MVRRELRHAEGYEFLADHLAAVLLDDVAHPLGRDLAEVVVGGDRVDFLAELLHHPRDQRRELLLGNRAGHDHMRVADAAFVLVVVEGKAVELVDDRPVSFARGARKAGEHGVHLILLQNAPHELLEARVVGLRVVDHELEWTSRDPAGLVDLVGGKLDAVDLADRRKRKVARLILKHSELDRLGGLSRECHHHRRHRGAQHQYLAHVQTLLGHVNLRARGQQATRPENCCPAGTGIRRTPRDPTVAACFRGEAQHRRRRRSSRAPARAPRRP